MNGEVLELRGLSRFQYGSQSPLWWGVIGIVAIEATVFSCLIASFFFLGLDAESWPPPGTKQPDLLLPTLGTALLLASGWSMHRADSSVDRGRRRGLLIGLAVSIALAAAFLALKVVEYSDVPYRWDTHAYGSIVWTTIGFHGAHVTILLVKTVVVFLLAWRGYFDRERRLGVTINGIYWQFVVAVWIPLYAVLYLSPRLLGGDS